MPEGVFLSCIKLVQIREISAVYCVKPLPFVFRVVEDVDPYGV